MKNYKFLSFFLFFAFEYCFFLNFACFLFSKGDYGK